MKLIAAPSNKGPPNTSGQPRRIANLPQSQCFLAAEFLETFGLPHECTSRQPGKDDDDSWGKLASDLFGIQFDDEAEFDLPDEDEAPVKPVAVSAAAPVAAAPFVEDLDADFDDDDDDEDDLDDEDDDDDDELEEDEDEVAEAVAESALAEREPDDFWDALAEWDWDEPAPRAASLPGTPAAEAVIVAEAVDGVVGAMADGTARAARKTALATNRPISLQSQEFRPKNQNAKPLSVRGPNSLA